MKTGANEWGEEKKEREEGEEGRLVEEKGTGGQKRSGKEEGGGDVAAVGIGNGRSPLSPFAWPAEIKPV